MNCIKTFSRDRKEEVMKGRATLMALGLGLGMAGVTMFSVPPVSAQNPGSPQGSPIVRVLDNLAAHDAKLVTHDGKLDAHDGNLAVHDARVLDAIAGIHGGLTHGVIEIDQARAEAGGVTPGDGPGFPVKLTTPGSYRLTGNLTVDQNTSAIQIWAPDVTLDLNGFSIRGPAHCVGTPVTCTAEGIGDGITTAAAAQHVAVMNGSVTGMGGDGVRLQGGCRAENLNVHSNAGTGIYAWGGCIVRGNNLYLNKSDGVQAGYGSLIRDNTFNFNGGFGLKTLPGTGYAGNVFRGNNLGSVQNGVNLGGNVCEYSACP